jgi:hypothetical protein
MTETQQLAHLALDASGLPPSRFARALGVSVEALRTWTTGTRTVSGPARILLGLWVRDADLARYVCGVKELETEDNV